MQPGCQCTAQRQDACDLPRAQEVDGTLNSGKHLKLKDQPFFPFSLEGLKHVRRQPLREPRTDRATGVIQDASQARTIFLERGIREDAELVALTGVHSTRWSVDNVVPEEEQGNSSSHKL